MFERIVVAVDGSRQGGKTVPVALDMAKTHDSAVTVIHVREHTRYEGSDVDLAPDAGTGEELVRSSPSSEMRASSPRARCVGCDPGTRTSRS